MAEKERIIIDLDFDVTDFTKAAAQLNGEIARLNKEQRELKKQGREGSIEFQRNSEDLRENKKELSDTNRVIQNLTIANIANAGSNEQLQAQLSILTLEYNLMSKAQREGTKEGKNLTAQIDQITSELKGSEEAVGNNRRSVGDYEKGTRRLREELKGLRKEFNDLSKEEQNNAQVGGVLIQKIEKTNDELIMSQKELDKYNSMLGKSGNEVGVFGKALSGTPFGGFISGIRATGAAFLANPIGLIIAAIVGALALLYKAFTRSEEGGNKISKVMGALGAVFSGLMKALEPVANFIFDVIIYAFDQLAKAAEDAMALVSSGLELLGFDNAAKGVRDFVNSSNDLIATSQRLAEAEAELVKVRREQRIVQLESQNAAEKQRQIRDDESKSIEERKRANEELGRILEEQSAKELAMAQKAMEVALLRQKIDGDTTEVLDEIAQAKLELIDIEERITGQQSEQLVNINSLNRDAAQQAKDARAAAQQKQKDAIDANKQQLELLIAQQGINKKTLEEEVALAETVSEEKKKILKRELDAKLINQTQYQIQLIAIDNELLKKQTELVIENANKEFTAILEANQSKIGENQLLNDVLINQELERLRIVAEAEKEFQSERLANGIINQQEYNAALLAIDNAELEKKKELDEVRKAQEEERRIFELEAEEELRLMKAESDFEKRQIELDRQREQELQNAINIGAETKSIQEKFDLLELELTKKKEAAQLSEVAATFDAMGSLLSDHAESSKAFAIASATINAFQAITAVLSAASTIPEPFGSIAKGLQAIAIGKTAFQNVQKISSTKIPKAEKGGVFGGLPHSSGGTKGYFSDGTEIEVEKGELFAVVNKRNTSMLGQLSALNSFGGNGTPYFAKGGVQMFADGGVSLSSVSGRIEREQEQTNNLLRFIQELPSPVVAVQDINEVQSENNRVQARAVL